MKASSLPRPLRQGGVLIWQHLPTLIGLNVLWSVLALTLVLLGPVTLGVYVFIAQLRDDAGPQWRDVPGLLRRFLLPGLGWFVTLLVFTFLAFANLSYWPRVLGSFGSAVAVLAWSYLIWLFAALQPYLLEALTTERRPYLRAWGAAFTALARRPVSAHLYALLPASALLLGLFFRTLAPLVLVSLTLAFAAVQVRPLTIRPEPEEEWPSSLKEGQP
ncbi:hypothetical protein [Deinococcus irradiatisoli]|uniref:hypothetical protein n=1 Tax=Deinococcus irradiatisoli TaxID=2202254 RepID=UPI0015E8588B|nr:hypothetical protein [Deinococcus irradiatisoli]